MDQKDWKIEQRLITSLVPYEKNARTHSDEQVEQIARSIQEFGWTNPVLVKGDGIIAGHGRWLAAKKLGLERVPCIELAHLTPVQVRAYIIADNKLALNAGWNLETLQVELGALKSEGFDLSLTGFGNDEIAGLLDKTTGLTDPDEAPPPPKDPVSVPGDLWLLGRHRLLCGDAFSGWKDATGGEQVSLIATDPPYAIYGSSTGVSSDIADDKMVVPFFKDILLMAYEALPWFGHAYLCCDWRSWSAVIQGSRLASMSAKNMIVWDKCGSGMGNNYANAHELIAFFAKLPKQNAMGFRKAGQRAVLRPNLIKIPRVTPKAKEHNAAKPVALMEELITNSSDKGGLVLDPFLGSGTTMIACENLNRSCAATEAEPEYVDVAVLRWQAFTGKTATLDGTNATFDEIAKQRGKATIPPSAATATATSRQPEHASP